MIELREISGGYGKNTVVSDINVSFERGKITTLIGANGCGKSTLLQICAGLLTPFSGEVRINGKPLGAYTRNEAARIISFLPQLHMSGNLSVRALVSHGRFPYLSYPRRYSTEDREKISAAMETVGISSLADETVSHLSGGQQQKAYIAMLLAQDTEIMLLDEPTTYLDIGCQLELMEIICRLKAMGKTVVMVIHDLNLALRYSDYVCVMQGGEIVMNGTSSEIAQSGVLKTVFGVRACFDEKTSQYLFEMEK